MIDEWMPRIYVEDPAFFREMASAQVKNNLTAAKPLMDFVHKRDLDHTSLGIVSDNSTDRENKEKIL